MRSGDLRWALSPLSSRGSLVGVQTARAVSPAFYSCASNQKPRRRGPARRVPVAGRGARIIRLLGRLTLQLSKHQFSVLLEYAKASFKRIK